MSDYGDNDNDYNDDNDNYVDVDYEEEEEPEPEEGIFENEEDVITSPIHIPEKKGKYVHPEDRHNFPLMTREECNGLLGKRTGQLDTGSPSPLEGRFKTVDSYEIAVLELFTKCFPIDIIREFPDNVDEFWSSRELEPPFGFIRIPEGIKEDLKRITLELNTTPLIIPESGSFLRSTDFLPKRPVSPKQEPIIYTSVPGTPIVPVTTVVGSPVTPLASMGGVIPIPIPAINQPIIQQPISTRVRSLPVTNMIPVIKKISPFEVTSPMLSQDNFQTSLIPITKTIQTPTIPVQPVMKPSIPVQPITKPSIPVQPVMKPSIPVQPITKPSIPVQSVLPIQPITKPSIPNVQVQSNNILKPYISSINIPKPIIQSINK
jgi:DNA-directed RNA polymerase subunit K/omega